MECLRFSCKEFRVLSCQNIVFSRRAGWPGACGTQVEGTVGACWPVLDSDAMKVRTVQRGRM